MKHKKKLIAGAVSIGLFAVGLNVPDVKEDVTQAIKGKYEQVVHPRKYSDELPTTYDGKYQEIIINDNKPEFSKDDLSTEKGDWQTFSNLDSLNRVGVANTLITQDSFPNEERIERLQTSPSGWKQKKLDNGEWVYNRSHLIGFQLTGENDNPLNLMTGTRSFNTPHMLNYENQIKAYIHQTNDVVRYRVTPHFIGNELVARGVQLEAQSRNKKGLLFNVYIFNVEDGYTIDYMTGKSIK